MREILFRGKRTDGGEWVYGFLCKTYSPINPKTRDAIMHENKPPFPAYSCAEIDVETVGQYTGLTDKNGTKIFEGDIVKADDYIFVIKFGKCGGTPNTDKYGYMGFYLEALSEGTKVCAKYGLRDDICYFEDIEIIDNIHDNRLLLKGE